MKDKYIAYRDYAQVANENGENPSEIGYLKYLERHSPEYYKAIARATVALQGGIGEENTRNTKEEC